MKNLACLISVLTTCALLSSCGVLCQAGTGTCGMSKDDAQRLLNPKSYGQYWTKPEMTTESWRKDWGECGGMQSGDYGIDVPAGSTSAAVRAASERTRTKLDACMQAKGYQYSYTK